MSGPAEGSRNPEFLREVLDCWGCWIWEGRGCRRGPYASMTESVLVGLLQYYILFLLCVCLCVTKRQMCVREREREREKP